MYKLVIFIPEEAKERVKGAMFSEGAGKIGNYDCCSFELKGEGQFRALKGSNPHIGEQGKLEKVVEYRVEMVCEDSLLKEDMDDHPLTGAG